MRSLAVHDNIASFPGLHPSFCHYKKTSYRWSGAYRNKASSTYIVCNDISMFHCRLPSSQLRRLRKMRYLATAHHFFSHCYTGSLHSLSACTDSEAAG